MTTSPHQPDFTDVGLRPPTRPVDRELYHLRTNLKLILSAPPGTFTIDCAFSVLECITAALRSLLYLVRTHESLTAAGEPLAQELETALDQLVADLPTLRPGG